MRGAYHSVLLILAIPHGEWKSKSAFVRVVGINLGFMLGVYQHSVRYSAEYLNTLQYSDSLKWWVRVFLKYSNIFKQNNG